jgi:hypothetical protein
METICNGSVLVLEPSDFNFSKDVWSVIIQFIPVQQLAKFRIVNMFQRLVTIEQRKRATTLDDPISLAQIMDFAYLNCIVSHVTHQRMEYYPFNTLWYKRPVDLLEREHDPNLTCDGDESDECETREDDILIPDPGESIIYHFNTVDRKFQGDGGINYGKAKMVMFEKSLVYLPHAVRLINKRGMNHDHRGRNHANIMLDLHKEYTIPAGIHSVYDIVQSCFRIKGNKFENNYEMFCSFLDEDFDPKQPKDEDLKDICDVIVFDSKKCEWKVSPNIDHGS